MIGPTYPLWRTLYELASKPRIFISYHHADREAFERLSTVLHDQYQVVTDRSLDEAVESDDCDYVYRRISEEFITGTSCTFVLCGRETASRKFVDWEIKATLDKKHGLIAVDGLPGSTLFGA